MTLNLFNLPDPLPHNEEFTEVLHSKDLKIERIVSTGQTTPAGEWYDQDEDEWVVLIQGEAVLEYENGEKTAIYPPETTSSCQPTAATASPAPAHNPPCIWIAVFGKLRQKIRQAKVLACPLRKSLHQAICRNRKISWRA